MEERNKLIDKVYYINHKEQIKVKKHEWYIKNRERILEKQREKRNKLKEIKL